MKKTRHLIVLWNNDITQFVCERFLEKKVVVQCIYLVSFEIFLEGTSLVILAICINNVLLLLVLKDVTKSIYHQLRQNYHIKLFVMMRKLGNQNQSNNLNLFINEYSDDEN